MSLRLRAHAPLQHVMRKYMESRAADPVGVTRMFSDVQRLAVLFAGTPPCGEAAGCGLPPAPGQFGPALAQVVASSSADGVDLSDTDVFRSLVQQLFARVRAEQESLRSGAPEDRQEQRAAAASHE